MHTLVLGEYVRMPSTSSEVMSPCLDVGTHYEKSFTLWTLSAYQSETLSLILSLAAYVEAVLADKEPEAYACLRVGMLETSIFRSMRMACI